MINWDKPKQLRSTKEHNDMFQSEAQAAGTYVPNMSNDDQNQWKGKHINKGKDTARIELRKTFSSCNDFAHILIVVKRNDGVTISANGKMGMTFAEWEETIEVTNEARELI